MAGLGLASLGLLTGCGGEEFINVDVPQRGTASSCSEITGYAREAGHGQVVNNPVLIRDAGAQMRQTAMATDDNELRMATLPFADAMVAYADALAGRKESDIALRRGDLSRLAPPVAARCGYSYDRVLSM